MLRGLSPPYEAGSAQLASRADAATVAPGVTVDAVTFVAGMGVLQDEVDELRAAEALRQRPGVGLVDPHERRMQHEARLHAEVDGGLQGLDGVVAAVRI